MALSDYHQQFTLKSADDIQRGIDEKEQGLKVYTLGFGGLCLASVYVFFAHMKYFFITIDEII